MQDSYLPQGQIYLPCISMWQPWASWVAWGWKPIETRTHNRFKSLVGKRTGIHAARKWDHDALKIAQAYLTPEQVKRTISLGYEPPQGILCTAYVNLHAKCNPRDADQALIECETLRYGLFLEQIQRIQPPLRVKGRQGIWREICPESVHGSYVDGVSFPVLADQDQVNRLRSAESEKSGVKKDTDVGEKETDVNAGEPPMTEGA